MKKTPYKPTPYKEGCKDQIEYERPFSTTCSGFTGTATYVDFTDKKGNEIKKYFLRIAWD